MMRDDVNLRIGDLLTAQDPGRIPLGSSGFYNSYNNYSWTALAADFNDGTGPHLFFGTMDQSAVMGADISNLRSWI
jgi:hypothetical protein